jgi:AcrR family transcriptional regulator
MSTPTEIPAALDLPIRGRELPTVGSRPERADAARNRERILAAAADLFARQGVAGVSMDAVAERAGVGKGTLYRRFGDRAGLVIALLSEQEAEFQEAFIRGPAPLGPGAPAAERLRAFVDAMLEWLESGLELLVDAESSGGPGARYQAGPYEAYHTHVALLLRELGYGDEARLLAHVVLAPLAANLQAYLRRTGFDTADIRRGVARVVTGLVADATPRVS